MDTRFLRKLLIRAVSTMATAAMILSLSTVASAASNSPFFGHWQATDQDGSDMNLTIAGGPTGPFQITWTDSYFSRCNGGAGIIRGTGWLHENDSELLDADLLLECFTPRSSLAFHVTLRYAGAANVLFMAYDPVTVTIWHRPTRPQAPPPSLNLRVDYGNDWVESFYEGGHTAWIAVTESDGITVKATAQLVTEPKEYWGGETGFQSLDGVWLDPQRNPMASPPDIQPYDWVLGWVDNGANAKVQIGAITGRIGLLANSVEGTITASWLTSPVSVECLDWGSGGVPFPNQDGGSVLTDGVDSYYCSWGSTWDIQPGQTVGVGYSTPDGNWVANAFTAPNPRIVASEAGDWFWTTEFYPGTLDFSVYESSGAGAALLKSGQVEADPAGFAFVDYSVLGLNLVSGNYVIISDGVNEKGLILRPITMEVFDTVRDLMRGTAPAGTNVWVAAGPQDWQTGMSVIADPETGSWTADFTKILFDITEDMRPWSYAQIFDEDGDANEADAPPLEIIVSSVDDVLANDGVCTLREAIIAANTNVQSGNMGGECPAGSDSRTDTIVLAADQTYSLTIDSTGNENSSADGDLDIWDNSAATDLILKVEGGGTATVSQNAAVDDRVLDNLGATAEVEGLTLTGGGNVADGGGVFNTGTLVLTDCTISSNAANYGGGLANWGGTITLSNTTVAGNSAFSSSGGIHNKDRGILNIENGSLITGNRATWDGGGINNWDGTVTIKNSTVSDNSAPQSGGGINNLASGNVELDASVLSGNSATGNEYSGGGGLANWGGQVILVDSAVSNNTASWGGGLLTWGGTLTLNGSTVAGNIAYRGDGGIQIKNGAIATIQAGSAISENSAPNGYGGGVSNWGSTLTIDTSIVKGNSAAYSAGGILNKDGGTTTVQNASLISGNSAIWEGGISNWGSSTLTVIGSVVSDNTASGSSGGIGNLGTLTVEASTISGNSAPWGGGLLNLQNGRMTVTGSIIRDNTGTRGGGGIMNLNGALTVTGSAILNNSSPGEGDAIFSSVDSVNATSVTGSCLVGNGVTAVFNDYSTSQDFKGNWWGDPSGPSGAGPGSGDSVGANVDFWSWLTEPLPVCR